MIGWQLHLRICFFFLFFICPAPVLLVILTCFLCGMASFPLFFWATGLVVTSLTPCLILNLFCSFSIRPAMANGFHECCGCSWTSQIGDLISSNYQDFLKFGCLFKIAFGRAGGLWSCSCFCYFVHITEAPDLMRFWNWNLKSFALDVHLEKQFLFPKEIL